MAGWWEEIKSARFGEGEEDRRKVESARGEGKKRSEERSINRAGAADADWWRGGAGRANVENVENDFLLPPTLFAPSVAGLYRPQRVAGPPHPHPYQYLPSFESPDLGESIGDGFGRFNCEELHLPSDYQILPRGALLSPSLVCQLCPP